MRRSIRTAAVAALATALMAAGPAAGDIFDRGSFTDEQYEFAYDCGFPMQVTGVASGKYRLRDGGNGTFFGLDRVAFREVHTNTATGEWFVVRGRFTNIETRARAMGGTLYEFDVVKAGQVHVVEDSSGEIVSRDRGAIRRTLLFDTGGDSEPGGTVVELVDLRLAGPHPGFGELCTVAEELTTHA